MTRRLLWWGWSLLVIAFLLAPIAVVIPLSFSTGSFLSFPLPGIGLRWYDAFFGSDFWRLALENSIFIGLMATVGSTMLGTAAAVGLWSARFPGQGAVMAVIVSPMVVPSIITAVAMTFAYGAFGLANSYAGMIVAHIALTSPFVVVTVLATLQHFDKRLMQAASASGAPPLTAFRRVMLPLILPGVVAGALFALAVSLDESVVVLFLAGPGQRTLPRQMFAGLKDTIELTIMAAATILIVVATLLMAATTFLRRTRRA